jgi:hypothetical protein
VVIVVRRLMSMGIGVMAYWDSLGLGDRAGCSDRDWRQEVVDGNG